MKRGSGVAIDAFGVVTVEGFESVVSVVAAFRADTLGLVVNTDANNVELVAVDVVGLNVDVEVVMREGVGAVEVGEITVVFAAAVVVNGTENNELLTGKVAALVVAVGVGADVNVVVLVDVSTVVVLAPAVVVVADIAEVVYIAVAAVVDLAVVVVAKMGAEMIGLDFVVTVASVDVGEVTLLTFDDSGSDLGLRSLSFASTLDASDSLFVNTKGLLGGSEGFLAKDRLLLEGTAAKFVLGRM